MKITAAVEYAVQALLEIATATSKGNKINANEISELQKIPAKFLEKQLGLLKRAGFIHSERGSQGGYFLAKPSQDIYVADVIRVIEGPLAAVSDKAPELAKYKGAAVNLTEIWIATRVALRNVLENVSLQDILDSKYEKQIVNLISTKDAWKRRVN